VTDPSAVTLEEVRDRFLQAETRLGDAASAIQAIEAAATQIGSTRESLMTAGTEVRALAGQFSDVASSLTTNADELRRGVDAIRLGDPAAVRRQIEELDAAFTAMHSVMADRFSHIEATQTSLAAAFDATGNRQDASAKSMRTEARIIGAVTALLVALSIVLLLIR
jgi:hypothetical protein